MIKPFKPTKAHKEAKWKQAIKLLNDLVKIKIATSTIHGVGVFAVRNLKKGDKLYADAIPNAFDIPYKLFRRMKPDVADIILGHWPNVVNGAHFLYPVTKMTAFINHSDNFNYDIIKDEMLKDVRSGEEVTMNYRCFNNWEKIFKWLK